MTLAIELRATGATPIQLRRSKISWVIKKFEVENSGNQIIWGWNRCKKNLDSTTRSDLASKQYISS